MRRIFIPIICLLFSLNASSQTSILKGTVLDHYGHPLKGADVRIKNGTAATATDGDGKFDIAVTIGDVMQFSHPDYNVTEEKVIEGKEIVVRMDDAKLKRPAEKDVLYEVKDVDKILGSVSTIYTNQLTTTPSRLYAHAFPGRFPGLYTHQYTGWGNTNLTSVIRDGSFFGNFPSEGTVGSNGPTDNNEIYLRLRGQSPVTIVDGIQRDIYTISPENIESVSVLKDGLSTILLGQQSSRGAIVVTTKKPLTGSPHLSLTAQYGVQSPLKLPKPLSAFEYAYLQNEAYLNEGKAPIYTSDDLLKFKNGSDPYGHPDVNWFNTALKNNAAISRYDLGLTGGGNVARYMVGLGFFQQDGLFRTNNPDYNTNAQIRRYTLNSSIDVDVTKYLNTQLQIYGLISDGNQPGATTQGVINAIYNTPNNTYPVYNPNGSLGGTEAFKQNIVGMLNQSGYINDYVRDISANLALKYKFDELLKGLWGKVQSNLSVYTSNYSNRSKIPPTYKLILGASGDTAYAPFGKQSDLSNSFTLTNSAQYWYLQGALGFDRDFGLNNIGTKLFYDRRESVFNYDLPMTLQNFAWTGSYDFAKKYFLEAAVNYSGNDRFAPGKQFGLFYGAGAGWDMARENFMSGSDIINKAKWRLTFAKTGNANIGYFSWRETYSRDIFTNVYPIGVSRSTPENYLNMVRLANPDATWEKANKFNIGLDLAFFKNHLLFTTDFYNDKYYDLMLMRSRQSGILGVAYPVENIGINRYTGTEFELTWQNNFKNLNYFLTGNLSIEKSEVVYFDEVATYSWNKKTGLPVDAIFGYQADGFIQTPAEAASGAAIGGYKLRPGDIRLKDFNGDGVINLFDQVAIGGTKPLIYYGTNFGFSIKGFDVAILLQGVKNRQYVREESAFGLGGNLQGYDYAIGRWTPENASTASYPRLTPGYNTNNDISGYGTGANSLWMKNGDYFRLKNASIGYTFPYRWTSRFKLSAIRLFANGLNLFTWAAYDKTDPEVYNRVYPLQKVINAGINVKF